MVPQRNQPEIINVSEGVDLLTELVDRSDDLRSKYKGISFKYNLGKNQYDFVDTVYFYATLQPENKDSQVGSLIKLNLTILKVYIPLIPDTHDPDRDSLIKIIIQNICEYSKNGNIVQDCKYEINL